MMAFQPWRRAGILQRAPFLRILPALAAGILLHEWLGLRGTPLLTAPGAAAVLLLFLATVLPRREPEPLRRCRPLLLQGAVLCLSLLCCALADHRGQGSWYGHSLARSSAHQLRVAADPQLRERSWKVPVEFLAAIDSSGAAGRVSGRATLYLYRNGDTALPLHEGDVVVAANGWQPIRNDGNPAGFDLERFSRHNNLFHSQVCGQEELLLYQRAQPSARSLLSRGHRWCVAQLRRYLPDRAAFGLLQAMLMGDERDFDEELRQAYAETGVVHIVSISGSHTATLFLIVTLLFFWLRSKRWAWIKFVLGVLLVWVYVLMAGAPPSALRAAVMFSVFALGAIIGRQGHPLNTLFAAAFILLCSNPAWLFSVGFQLSFSAVLSLLLFYRPIYRCWPQSTWLGKQLWALTAGSLAAELITAPLVVYYFHSFPLLFLIANALAMLLVGLVAMGGGLAMLAFCWLPPVAKAAGWLVIQTMRGFNRAIFQLQELTPAAMHHLRLSGAELLLCYAVIAGFGAYLHSKKKWQLQAGGLAACLLMGMLLNDAQQRSRQSRFIVYNAGRRLLAELHAGAYHHLVAADSLSQPVRPADALRNTCGAWKAGAGAGPCFRFGSKRVLVLQEPPGHTDSAAFPVDVLVAGFPLRPEQLPGLRACFRPGTLVVAGYQKRWVKEALEDSVAAGDRMLYLTWQRGAYVLE